MLVLSRQRDETIMIGDEVEITVVDVRGDKVRLGISAPPSIAVHRKEVYEAIKAENRRAASVDGVDLTGVRRSSLGRTVVKPGGAARLVQPTQARSGGGGGADAAASNGRAGADGADGDEGRPIRGDRRDEQQRGSRARRRA
jgi:carbon storage regulator